MKPNTRTDGVGHTPGPWQHVPEDNLITTYAGRCIAEWQARSTHVSVEERDANARLIAAAPDMLEMLITAYALLAGSYGSQQFEDQCGHMAQQMADVIIKAAGKADAE